MHKTSFCANLPLSYAIDNYPNRYKQLDKNYSNTFLKICAQNALPSLRSVSVELKNGKLLWQSVFDKDANENDIELTAQASGEFSANFQEIEFEENNIVIEFLEKINHLENLVYYRHEDSYFKE